MQGRPRLLPFAPGEIALLPAAVRLALAAQAVREGASLEQLRRRMLLMRRGTPTVEPGRAVRVALWVSRTLGDWFGLLNSCLTRSLVLASLLSGHENVAVCLGFRRVGSAKTGEEVADPLAGHAWVVLDGVPLPRDSELDDEGRGYETAMTLDFSETAGGRAASSEAER